MSLLVEGHTAAHRAQLVEMNQYRAVICEFGPTSIIEEELASSVTKKYIFAKVRLV